jgi:hypothetical protein
VVKKPPALVLCFKWHKCYVRVRYSLEYDDLEEWHLLGWYVMWLLYEPTFRRN